MKSNHGFTLLELMVAMAIFAMLAVAGWQVFDGVNRARERAQFHADNLAVLQYAYLQLQQDMNQMIPYQAVDTQGANSLINNAATNNTANNNGSNNNANNSNQENAPAPEPFMSLEGARISFVRFADPDPRYQSSASLQHIEYIFADEGLIRRQYTSLAGGSDSISLDSVLLEGVTAGRWQAYLPELSAKFPNKDNRNNISNNAPSGQTVNSANKTSETILLPKGIALNFTYQDMPITWQWALTPQPIPNVSTNNSHKNTPNNSNGDSNSNNNNNGNSNGGTNNDSEANGNAANNSSGNATENTPFGQ